MKRITLGGILALIVIIMSIIKASEKYIRLYAPSLGIKL